MAADEREPSISRQARTILLALTRSQRVDYELEELATITNLSRTAVKQALTELDDRGLISLSEES